MHQRAKYHSVIRCCILWSLWTGLEALSCGQSPPKYPNFDTPHPAAASGTSGGWTRSQPGQWEKSSPVGRTSYYRQFDGQIPVLPSLPNGLPQAGFDTRSGVDSINPSPQWPLQDRSGTNSASVNPSQQIVPAAPAAFQSGQNSILPPQTQPQSPPSQSQVPAPQSFSPQSYPPQSAQQPSLDPNLRPAIATGLPHVTPAPSNNPRGNYPTSPYMGRPMFINAAYQRPTTANYPSQVPNNGGTTLPQNLQPNSQPIFTNAAPGVYPTAYPQQCAPSLPPGEALGAYVPPTITPNWNPNLYSPDNSGYRPIFSLGQENYNVVLGRGILGQPTAYVPGQYIRNFLRYIFP